MAKITFAGGVSAMSGSIGGNVFSRNANGAYVRNKGIPTNPNTLPQQAARALLAAGAAVWNGLTNLMRQTFRDQVVNYPYTDNLGQKKTYTPFQLCNTVNGRIKQANRYTVLAGDSLPAPIVNFMPPPVSFPNVEDASPNYVRLSGQFAINVGLLNPVLEDGVVLLIDATAPLSNGVTAPKASDFRNMVAYGSNISLTDQVFSATFYEAVFGELPPIDSNIFMRYTTFETSTGVYQTSVIAKLTIYAE